MRRAVAAPSSPVRRPCRLRISWWSSPRPAGAGTSSGGCWPQASRSRAANDAGSTDWLDQPLALALHHVNGDKCDDRLENLALLCPNCHSQTENFAGRNVVSRAGALAALAEAPAPEPGAGDRDGNGNGNGDVDGETREAA